MAHFSAVKFTKDNEKNMSFLLISKSLKVWEKFEAIGPGTFKSLSDLLGINFTHILSLAFMRGRGRGWFNTSPCCNALSQPILVLYYSIMYGQHEINVILCTQCEFLQFRQYQIHFDRCTYDCEELFLPLSQVNSLLKIGKFQNSCLSHVIQWLFSLLQYNGWEV